ncbi:MAG: type II toxin-antitoxin system VapC family toxin [Candidatus Sumerlaeota bacterium]|nr:type II toxin-antitoxin system VapC family toxin [Candidatus Sumerlaeota bacterium]
MIADSNILIYAVNQANGVVRRWLVEELPSVSAISRVEVLGYHGFKAGEQESVEELLRALRIIYPSQETFRLAVNLRQRRRISVADALIAATALEHGERLATHNTEDFSWIEEINLFDPLREAV